MAEFNLTPSGDDPWDSAHGGDGFRGNPRPFTTLPFVNTKPKLTLGEVIDGYINLTEAEKSVFSAACLGGATGGNSGVKQHGVSVAPGTTRDPKTGKVFKLVKKKDKSAERLRLEGILERSKKEYSEFLREYNIVLGDDGQPLDEVDPETWDHARGLATTVGRNKDALAAYKAAHPEEFLPPPNKKLGLTPQEVLASLNTPGPNLGSGSAEKSAAPQIPVVPGLSRLAPPAPGAVPPPRPRQNAWNPANLAGRPLVGSNGQPLNQGGVVKTQNPPQGSSRGTGTGGT